MDDYINFLASQLNKNIENYDMKINKDKALSEEDVALHVNVFELNFKNIRNRVEMPEKCKTTL